MLGSVRFELMSFIETMGIIGDLLSLLGLGLGIPLYLIGTLLYSTDKKMLATEVVTTDDGGGPQLRWFAAGDFYERPLRLEEADYFTDQDYCEGYVKPRRPGIMRLEPQRQITRICRVMGTTLVAIGLVGFLLSLLPLLRS